MVASSVGSGRLINPPPPSRTAFSQKIAGNPNAEPIEPNITGPITREIWFTVMRKPSASPERPSAE